MTVKVTTRTAGKAISDRTPFVTSGSMKGIHTPGINPGEGILPDRYRSEFRSAMGTGDVYVVYSYGTPIAWHTEKNGWYVPNVKYSVTTSKHQSNLTSVVSRNDWSN